MKHDPARYRKAAGLVVGSTDPLEDLLEIARYESMRVRRRQKIAWGAAAAAVVVIGIGLLIALGGNATDDPSTWGPHQKADWVLTILKRQPRDGISPSEEQRLRGYLDDHSSRVRRASLLALSRMGRELDPEVLQRMVAELTETLDLPEEFASSSGSEVGVAHRIKRTRTLQAVARAIWFHCAKYHTYAFVETIELLAAHPDEEVRASAYHALGEISGYLPTDEMIRQLNVETEKVIEAAQKLLRKN